MSNEQVRILASKLNMPIILKALKEYSKEKAKKCIHIGNMPPPLPGSKDSESAYLTSLGITKDWISRITKLNANTSTFKTTPKIYNFSSDIAVRYREFALSGQKSAIHKVKYSDANLFKKAIAESVAFEHSKNLSKAHQNNKYFAKIQEAVCTMHSSFIGPRTEIGQEIHNIYTQKLTKYPEEAVKEAFNTATNSDFIGPRTEIGQEVHNIYKSKLSELAKDKKLFLFVEQLLTEFAELEQKYGSDVLSENNKVGRLNRKQLRLFQQENESANDESPTKDDTQPEDSNKKSEKSDSETAVSPRLLSSNDSKNDKSSDNKKSLLALRSSDEEDKGYETDEELEESNSTTDEELKKDMLVENEDEAIDVSFKTEAIVEQDEATQRQQVSDDTSRKVAILVKATSILHKPVHYNILSDRLKIAAIGADDEEASINRGIWISGLYGINKQGTWKNIPKYQDRTTGVTIGADTEFINSHDVIGIAYSRLESQIKYNKKQQLTVIFLAFTV